MKFGIILQYCIFTVAKIQEVLEYTKLFHKKFVFSCDSTRHEPSNMGDGMQKAIGLSQTQTDCFVVS